MRQDGKLSISIIDDDEAVRDSLTGLVESLGAVARAYPSLAAFLEAPEHRETGCLLLDWSRQPDATSRTMRALAERRLQFPVVAMVRDEARTTRASAICDGADAVLPRPFTEVALLAAIRDARQHRSGSSDASGLQRSATRPA